jgi:hypothetical protein
MALFPSEAWLTSAVSVINGQPDLARALEGLGPDLAAVIEPDAVFTDRFAAWGRQAGGRIAEFRVLEDEDDILELEPAYVIRAPYGLWKDLLRRRVDPVQVALSGKLRVRGDLEALVRRVAYRHVFDAVMARVPTEFADEARR